MLHLGDPSDDKYAVNKQYLEQSHVKPTPKTDLFAYLMKDKMEWSDEAPGGNSFDMVRIADLLPDKGNIHPYSHKVIYITMVKNLEGGYRYKMSIQCFRLTKDIHYSLCLEIMITDYQLWHKTIITVDKATSKGLTICNVYVKKFSHRFAGSNFMYYHRVIDNFQKRLQLLCTNCTSLWISLKWGMIYRKLYCGLWNNWNCKRRGCGKYM